MKQRVSLFFYFTLVFSLNCFAQCPDCGNGTVNTGESNLNCPQDVPHPATCTSPCAQPTSFETASGIRFSWDFIGTTTYSRAATNIPTSNLILNSGSDVSGSWLFAGADALGTGNTAVPINDAGFLSSGTVQPNCSGGCSSTNGFCIGNLANSNTVGSGGSGGKLGANFDGRVNVAANTSYAILRGSNRPTLVSPTFNFSGVESFKIQFWLATSESSCGQSNSWGAGSCSNNINAFLDFSSNNGSSWTQIMEMDMTTSSDMCSATNNTRWLTDGGGWNRVCLTVFKSTTSPGNFYSTANGTSAFTGIMMNSTWFVSQFKFRIRYVATSGCIGASNITPINPGKYLAIDFPTVTSGNQCIPCGISFANMCGYGADNNDEGVGSSTLTTTATAFGTVRRGVNHAERGVEIFNSQNASFAAQNLSGSSFASNFDLCNAEGGDRQCIDWRSNNNNYLVVYECIADWEAPSGNGINVQYYKNTSPQSFGLTKVTSAGRTAQIGWRYSGSRFVNCSTGDLNPGCNGYSFLSGSLPTQFSRGFYALSVNNIGQSWSYYGASSCSNYFNGPFFAPIAVPTPDADGNFFECSGANLVFSANVSFCSSSGFSANSTLEISGPAGFSETLISGGTGSVPISIAGDYIINANTPLTPAQCIDCGRNICITVSDADISSCTLLEEDNLLSWKSEKQENRKIRLDWKIRNPDKILKFSIQRSTDAISFEDLAEIYATDLSDYNFMDAAPLLGENYYRLIIENRNGEIEISNIISEQINNINKIAFFPNPASSEISIFAGKSAVVEIINSAGITLVFKTMKNDTEVFDISSLNEGVYIISIKFNHYTEHKKLVIKR
jgi:hypothetical protein